MVLISTWREEFGGLKTRKILTAQGLSEQWHADFCAPSVGAKGDDILAWLTTHSEVNRWAAVDDDLLWPPWGEQRIGLARNHIRPEFHDGMSPADWQMLKDRLLTASVPL